MSNPCARYQLQQFAKHHYRRLISAKGTLPQARETIRPPASRVDPIHKYEVTCTNHKLLEKLVQIYDKPSIAVESKRKNKKKRSRRMSQVEQPRGSLKSSFGEREESLRVRRQNDNLLERLVSVKPTVRQDWQIREEALQRYRALSRKTQINGAHETLYEAFRELKLEDAKKIKSKRAKSARINKKRPNEIQKF